MLPGPESVDIAPFGVQSAFRSDDGAGMMVEWRETRELHTVVVTFPEGQPLPPVDQLRVETWFSKWPSPRLGGWMHLDDAWNGRWLPAAATAEQHGNSIVWRFSPLTKEENPNANNFPVTYRCALKVRVLFLESAAQHAPSPTAAVPGPKLAVYGSSVWRTAALHIETESAIEDVEVVNGARISLEIHDTNAAITVRYAHNDARTNHDRGSIVVRTPGGGFSVFVDDVVREGALWIRGVEAFVAADGRKRAHWQRPATPCWSGTIRELTAQREEQDLAAVMLELPLKEPKYAPLGIPGGRAEIMAQPDGGWTKFAGSVRTEGHDKALRGWDDKQQTVALRAGENPDFGAEPPYPIARALVDGDLPLVETRWTWRGVAVRQECFVAPLCGDIGDVDTRTGEENIVLLGRVTLRNLEATNQTTALWWRFTPAGAMRLRDDGIVEHAVTTQPGLTRVAARFVSASAQLELLQPTVPQAGSAGTHSSDDAFAAVGAAGVLDGGGTGALCLRAVIHLQPGEEADIFYCAPYQELLNDNDLAHFSSLAYEPERQRTMDYWRAVIDQGMRIETPDRMLNEFYRANLWHVLISDDKDPATGMRFAHAGTIAYHTFANETCMIARALEMRGWHDLAAAYLEPFFYYQGTQALPGNFSSHDGVLWAAGEYTHLPYNMHHGFVLWAAAEHYWWTRDASYIAARRDKLLAGCEWIIRERRSTMREENGRRVVEYGLAPAGQLEDVAEFQYWYATNAYYYLGLKSVGDVLTALGDAEGPRLLEEAAAYKADIRASAAEMWARTPAVRLLDGTYVPYLPARAYARTHREEGWIREALYCALHLLDAGIYEPHDREVTHILDALEDTIFLSAESGYAVDSLEARWFHYGGFTLQPTLLFNAVAYLRRGEVAAFLRAFYNTFAASYYPDTRCFAEWVPEHGKGGGPLYKPPDECKFVQWLRLMLAREEGGALHLLSGVPRAWLADGRRIALQNAQTLFGTLHFEVESQVDDGRVTARVSPPARHRLDTLTLRLPHPQHRPMLRVTVDDRPWDNFDPAAETVTLPGTIDAFTLVATYDRPRRHS